MELRAVTYEELRTRHFTQQMRIHESLIEEFKKSKLGTQAKEDFLSDEGMKVQFYRDALNALNWIKIEPDEEGVYTGNLPYVGEEVIFCKKNGEIFIDELCSDGFDDDGNRMAYVGNGYDLDDIAAWMPLPKPFKGE